MAPWNRKKHREISAAGMVEYTESGQKIFRPSHHLKVAAQSSFKKKVSLFFENLNPATLFSRRGIPPLPRTIFVNNPLPSDYYDKKGRVLKDKTYPTNQNVTSKYTVITFLPRNLLEQFRRVANVFFLAIAILQFFPKFSTISPGLVILPLLAVLAITAGKDGYEDFKRHQSDHHVNHSITHVLGGGPKVHDHAVGHHHSLGHSHHDGHIDADGALTYHNWNSMMGKSKTFMPAINLPRIRSKKAKAEEKRQMELEKMRAEGIEIPGEDEDVGPYSSGNRRNSGVNRPFSTEALSRGVIASRDVDRGLTRPIDDDHDRAESPEHRLQRQVTRPDDDPEAFDDANEIGWKQTIWEDVKVGDFVKIYEDEQLPADIVICSTSEEEDVCYIETKNLDGETNLKSRHAVPELSYLRTAEDCARAHFSIDAEAADVNMFRLNGAVIMEGDEHAGPDGRPLVHPVDLQTALLRGTVIRNTAWVIGIVMFTGAHTKIILNSGGTPSKRSKVERQMNPQVLVNLALLALVSVVCAIVDHFNEVTWNQDQAYWELYADTKGDNPNINGLVTFANSFITFQNIVPISLYISIEFVRTAQAAFIYWDHSIKYVKNGVTTRTTARSWNLSDDLGQIEYVFSDKTGTLTQNVMVFRQCSIGGKIYAGESSIPGSTNVDPKNSLEKSDSPSSNSSDTPINRPLPTDQASDKPADKPKAVKEVLTPFHDADLLEDLNDTETEQSRLLNGFFAVLGLCHTVLTAELEKGVIEYKAQSPDEAALVQAAADVGFVFRGRDRNILKLSTPFSDVPDEYELLQVLEFNSTRKRMSVVIRKLDDQQRIFLLCKGADNVIFERLAPGNEELKQKTDADLQFFASEGLRTLCLAYRVVSQEEYDVWNREYHDATIDLEDRAEKMDAVSAKIECGLTLLGSTAIEDRLQDGVPETIADLKRAGIKVWVATGDKLETAVAIGYTTNLLTKDTNLIIVRDGGVSVYDQLKSALEGFFGEKVLDEGQDGISRGNSIDRGHELRRLNTGVTSLVGAGNGTRPGGYSLVIDGGALHHAFLDEATEELLLHLSTQCNTVICCRVSPLQKAQVVRLIRDNLGVMCLAIGDGANDVSMIQAADIGVGISGEEGLQAVNSSDYGIAQFRFLKRLLFVHGHWSYVRNSNMILNFFYKNVIGIGVLFWFQIYCGWSTTYVFEYTYLLFWNVFWTLLPVIALGLFDRNIDADTLMALPELYRYGREGKWFNLRRFTYYMFQGLLQSAIVYFIICYAYVTTSARTDGYNVGQYEMSTVMVIGAVMVANIFTGLNTDAWTVWVWFGVLFGPVLIWIYTAIYSIIPPSAFFTYAFGNDHYLFLAAEFWFGWLFVFIVALLPHNLYKAWTRTYYPDDIDIMRNVRRFRPDIDVLRDPNLGGRAKDIRQPEGKPEYSQPEVSQFGDTQSFSAERPGDMLPRPSYHSARRGDALGNLRSAKGSQVDMATGLRRAESRGFDFDMEENGVAVSRMQSRLSEISGRRRIINHNQSSPSKNRFKSGSMGLPFSSLRNRAGSVLRPKKKGFVEHMEGQEGSDQPTSP